MGGTRTPSSVHSAPPCPLALPPSAPLSPSPFPWAQLRRLFSLPRGYGAALPDVELGYTPTAFLGCLMASRGISFLSVCAAGKISQALLRRLFSLPRDYGAALPDVELSLTPKLSLTLTTVCGSLMASRGSSFLSVCVAGKK